MTAPNELERAVERLKKAVVFADGASLVDHEDIDLLLSERAELLAAVERMRGALGRLATATERLMAAWPDTHVPGRKLCVEVSEALNDAKARAKTTPNAGERG